MEAQIQYLQQVEEEFGGQPNGEPQEEKVEGEEHDMTELEEMSGKCEHLKPNVEQYFDGTNVRAENKIFVAKAFEKLTKAEGLQHQATHTPFAFWCKRCLASRMVRHKHPTEGRRTVIVRDAENLDGRLANVSIDHVYLHARVGRDKEDNYNPPQFVMVDRKSGRVWSHRVPNKGTMEGASRLPKRMAQDLDNCGYADVKMQLKSDQEPAVVNLRIAMQDTRPQAILTNSLVGESESNGRVERAIRRM